MKLQFLSEAVNGVGYLAAADNTSSSKATSKQEPMPTGAHCHIDLQLKFHGHSHVDTKV